MPVTQISRIDKNITINVKKLLELPLRPSYSYIFIILFYILFIGLIGLIIFAIIYFFLTKYNITGGIIEVIKFICIPVLAIYILTAIFLAFISSKNKSQDLLSHIVIVFNNYINIIIFLLIAILPTALILSFVEVVTNNFFINYYQPVLNICKILSFLFLLFSLIILYVKAFTKANNNNISFFIFNMSFIFLLCIYFLISFKSITTYLLKNIFRYECSKESDLEICSSDSDNSLTPKPLISNLLIISDDTSAKNENKPLYIIYLILLIVYILFVCILGFLIISNKFKVFEISKLVGCQILNKLIYLLKEVGIGDDERVVKLIQECISKNCNKQKSNSGGSGF